MREKLHTERKNRGEFRSHIWEIILWIIHNDDVDYDVEITWNVYVMTKGSKGIKQEEEMNFFYSLIISSCYSHACTYISAWTSFSTLRHTSHVIFILLFSAFLNQLMIAMIVCKDVERHLKVWCWRKWIYWITSCKRED